MPRTRIATALIAACVLAAPATASGATKPRLPELEPVAAGEPCPIPELFTPLTGFGDFRSYALAPDGGFEAGGEGWTLEDGAAVGDGNEHWQVAGGHHTRSLTLPPGSSATSPTFCVDGNWPSFRLFARHPGKGTGTLGVKVIPADVARPEHRLGGGIASDPRGGWRLSHDLRLFAEGPRWRGSRRVAIRITAPSKGVAWAVDDVLVDPRCR